MHLFNAIGLYKGRSILAEQSVSLTVLLKKICNLY